MLSGVGPAEHLREYSIPVVHDLAGVGSHLQDHVLINLRYRDKANRTLKLEPDGIVSALKLFTYFLRWSLFGSGPMTTNVRFSTRLPTAADSR